MKGKVIMSKVGILCLWFVLINVISVNGEAHVAEVVDVDGRVHYVDHVHVQRGRGRTSHGRRLQRPQPRYQQLQPPLERFQRLQRPQPLGDACYTDLKLKLDRSPLVSQVQVRISTFFT